MDSEHELADLRERIDRLETMVTAARAAVMHGEPDWRARNGAATSALRRLLELPDRRPGAWEAAHVTALGDELRAVLHELEGGDR